MSSGLDLQFIKETYQRISDDELIRISTQNASGLTPEAFEIVKAEIKKRGLDDNIINAVEAQNKDYTVSELDVYCDIISKLPCPSCGSSMERLNATVTGKVISFILFTQYKKKIKVACPSCLDKANNNALVESLLLGWWGIPWGLIRTPQSIILNLRNKKTNHLNSHNDILRGFTLGHIGEIERSKSDQEMLLKIIRQQNA